MKTKYAVAIAGVACLLCLAATDWVNVQSSPRKKIGKVTFDLYSEVVTNWQAATRAVSTNSVGAQQWLDEGYVRTNIIAETAWKGWDGNRRIVRVVMESEELAVTRRLYDVGLDRIRVHRGSHIIPK